MNLDELPVGQHNKLPIPEFANETIEVTESSTLSLKERLNSKNPRIRFEASCELLKEITEATSSNNYYLILLKLLADSHSGVQEKALDSFLISIQKTPPKTIDEPLITVIVEKCIVSPKPNIKSKAVDALLLIAELPNVQSAIYDILKNYLCDKSTSPKVMAASLHSLTQLLLNFGNFIFPSKDVLKQAAVQAGSTNSAVKNEAMGYLKEAHRWIKDKILPFIEGLKPIQQEELKKCVGEGKAIPKRAIKGQAIRVEEVVNENSKEEIKKKFLSAEEVIVLGQFSEKWCNSLLELKKWSEKRDKLQELFTAINVERVRAENFSELGNTLRRLLKDSNVVVVNMTIKIIGQLAKVLREHFSAYSRQIFGVILQKCKDKKTATESQKCLENLMFSLKLKDMLDDIKEGLLDKSPQVKSRMCNWLETAVFPNTEKEVLIIWVKELAPILGKLTDDAVSEVRDDALSCLGAFKKLVKDDTLENLIKDMNIQKQQKIMKVNDDNAKEESKNNTVDDNSEKKNITNNSSEDKQLSRSIKSRSLSIRAKENQNTKKDTLNTKTNQTVKGKESQSAKGKENKFELSIKELKLEDVGILPTQEEAEKILVEKTTIVENFTTLEWKEKQKQLQDLTTWITSNPQSDSFIEALTIWLKSKLKEFKESNINVMKEAILLLKAIADSMTITKKFANVVVPGIAEKMGDAKLTEVCQNLLLSIADSATPIYVSTLIIHGLHSSKSINAIRTSVSFLMKMLDEYSIQLMPLLIVLDYAKLLLTHSNSQVRIGATKLITALYSQAGDTIKSIIVLGLKDTIYKPLESELAKTKIQTVELKRELKGIAKLEMESKKKSRDDINELLPRINIASLLTSKIINGLTDSAMKTRQEAKDEIEKILNSANNRILPIGLSPLMIALKTRMNEPCKNLTKGFIFLVGNLAVALGAACKQHSKVILKPLMWNLSDKQSAIREETLLAMDKFAESGGLEVVFSELGTSLEKDNPDLRREILCWLLKRKDQLPKQNAQSLVKPLIEVMQDRSKEIRELGEKLLELIINNVEYETFIKSIQDLKPAIKKSLQIILNKHFPDKAVIDTNGTDNKVDESIRVPSKSTVSNKKIALLPPRVKPSMKQSLKKIAPRASSKSTIRSCLSSTDLSKCEQSSKLSIKRSPSQTHLNFPMVISELPVDKVIVSTERTEEDKKLKWPTTEVRSDYVEKLKRSLKIVLNPIVYDNMFSNDINMNLEALKLFSKVLKHNFALITDIADLLFNWFTMIIIEQENIQMNKDITDFLLLYFYELNQRNYTLCESEAAAILPILCEKLGSTKLKDDHKSLIMKTCDICPINRVYGHLIATLESKNVKTKTEVLTILKDVVNSHGDKTVSARDIKLIASLVIDNSTKTEAVEFLAAVYKYRSEEIWNVIGEIPEQTKELLRAGFDKVSLVTPRKNRRDLSCDASSVSKKILSPEAAKKTSKDESLAPKADQLALNLLLKKICESTSPEKPRTQTIEQYLEMLKKVKDEKKMTILINLNKKIHDLLEHDKEMLISYSNQIFGSFSNLLKETFKKQMKDVNKDFLKYFLSMFSNLCAVKIITIKLNKRTLFNTLEELLITLLKMKAVEDKSISNTLNTGIIRLISSSNPTMTFYILFEVLKKYKRQGEEFNKLPGLAVKCMLRLFKSIETLIPSLDIAKILLVMHEYLCYLTVEEQSNNDDIGIKVIKNILNSIVKNVKEVIWEYYKYSIENHHTQDCYLKRWISLILEAMNSDSSRQTEELKVIFEGLKCQSTIKESIKKLSCYLKDHPDVDLNQYLSGCSRGFKQFIVKSLKECGTELILRDSFEDNIDLTSPNNKSGVTEIGERSKPPTRINTADLMEKINEYKALVHANSSKLRKK